MRNGIGANGAGAAVVELAIDGQTIRAREGEALIEVVRATGVELPTLCYHPSLKPYGACRLCLVEVSADGRTVLAPSCSTPVAQAMVVRTQTDEAQRARRLSMQLILARCSGVESLRTFAARMGVTDTPFERETEDCMMCGLCERVCRELIGQSAVTMAGRGAAREVTTPFDKESGTCIGCEACVTVCPTGKVRSRRENGRLLMDTWNTRLDLARCTRCGVGYAPARLVERARQETTQLGVEVGLCPQCRGRSLAERMHHATRVTPAVAGAARGAIESEGQR